MSLPDENKVGEALEYLALTDEQLGRLTGLVRKLDHERKVIKGLAYLDATGTVAEREAIAYTSGAYQKFVTDYGNAWAERETLNAKRETSRLTIEVWRSLNSNRRQAGSI